MFGRHGPARAPMPHSVTPIFFFLDVVSRDSNISGDLCRTGRQPNTNAKAAFRQWTAAGMPASMLLLGLATYGYVSHSRKTKLSGSSMPKGFLYGVHARLGHLEGWPSLDHPDLPLNRVVSR